MTTGSRGSAGDGARFGAWLLALLLAWTALPAAAGEGDDKEKEEFDPRVHLETEDDAAGVLRAAWRARSAEPPNWRMAIEKYLEVARNYGHTVFPQSERLYLPMRALVRRELTGLPKEGRELYGVLKGREAELAFRRALASGAPVELERVAAQYPCLPTAPRALYLLGEMARARGEPGRAVYYWQRLMSEYPDWSEAGRPALLTRSALVAAEAGRRGEGERLLAELRKTSGLVRLRIGETEFLAADELQRRLGAAGPGGGAEAAAEAGYWPTIGGEPAHGRCAQRAVDAGVRRWPTDFNKDCIGAAQVSPAERQRLANMGMTAPQGNAARRHPICGGGMVFLAGDKDLVAVRAMSGHPAWAVSSGDRSDLGLPCSRMTLPAAGDAKVFAVLGTPQVFNPYMGRQPDGAKSDITIRAYAMVGGKLKWKSGDREDEAGKEFLKSVDLVSAPVYAGGYVYCPAVKRSSVDDAWMLCFDAADGRLVWKTFMCAGQPVRVGQYHMAQQVAEDALPPAISEGLLAFVSNHGAVGVMDAASGDLLWIYLYDRVETSSGTNRFGQPVATKTEIWDVSAPIISEGMILAAPQDCPDLLALDLATGQLRWKSKRGTLRHVVGLSGDALVCSGGTEVVAFSARSGKRLWRGLLSGEEAGLGLVGRDFAVVPSTGGLQRYDLATGKLAASYRFQNGAAEAGNLIISGDVLVSAGRTATCGYYSWEEITNKLKAQIAADPQAARPLADMGEVHFSGEKFREAADFFKQALARVKPGERSEGLPLEPGLKRQTWESHSRLGEALEKDGKFEPALADYREAHKYVQDERETMTGHMRFARCMEGLSRWADAVAEYQESIYTKASAGDGGRSRYYDETHGDATGRKVMAGRFSQSQIERLLAARGREAYARQEAEARAHLEVAARARSATGAAEVVDRWPNSEAVSQALVLQSELLAADGKHADAAGRLREHLWRLPKSGRTLEVRARLALSYKAQGMAPLARSMLGRMQRASKDESFELGGRTWTVAAFVEQNMPQGQALVVGRGGAVPEIAGPLKTAWKVDSAGSTMLVPKANAQDLTGMVFLRQNNTDLVAVDINNGKTVWRKSGLSAFSVNPNFGQAMGANAVASSGVLVVASGNKLLGLAPGTGQVLWEQEIVEAPANNPNAMRFGGGGQAMLKLASGEGAVVALVTTMSFDPNTGQQSWKSRMLALDEATGKQLWTADKLAAGYSGSEQLVLCEGTAYFLGYEQARNRASLEAYDLADGSKRFAAEVSAGGSPGQMQLHAQGDRLLACAGNALQCYDTATGKLRWRSQFPGQWGFLSAVDDARVVCSVLAGNNQSMQLCAFEMDTGKKLWDSAAMAGQMQSPASQNFMGQLGYRFDPAPVTDRVLAVTTNWQTRKSSYAAFDGASGKLLWRTESGGMIGHQVAPPLVGREQAAAFVPGQGKGERRVWDLSSGKLLEKGELPAAYGFVAAQEGAVIQVSNAAIERLVSAAAPAGTGGGKGQ